MRKKYKIEGMTCSACQSHVQHAVEKLEGITSCNVNLLANSMEVNYNEEILKEETIIKAVDQAGYKAISKDMKKNTSSQKEKEHKGKTLITASIFALGVFYLCMGPMIYIPIPSIFKENPLLLALTELFLTLPVVYLLKPLLKYCL